MNEDYKYIDFIELLGTDYLNGYPVCTRDGRPVKILSVDEGLPAQVMAFVATPLQIDKSREKNVYNSKKHVLTDDIEEEIRILRNEECIRVTEGRSPNRFVIKAEGVYHENIPMEWQRFYYFSNGRHNEFIETEHDLISVEEFKHTN